MTSIAGPSTSSCGACAVTSIPDFREQDAIEMLRSISSRVPSSRPSSRTTSSPPAIPSRARCRRCSTCSTTRPGPEEENQKPQKFYDYVRTTVGDIREAEARQRIIVELYDKFFKVASPKPWINWVSSIRRSRWSISSSVQWVTFCTRSSVARSPTRNVHILDPFTGTGTFITRLLQSGLISREALERKYSREIHANEIVLMAYYIASVNIENVFHDLMGPDAEYISFGGICLTDTFQLGEEASDENLYSEQFPTNSRRVIEQKKSAHAPSSSAIRPIPSAKGRPTTMRRTNPIRHSKAA